MKHFFTLLATATAFSWSTVLQPLEEKMNQHICKKHSLILTGTGTAGIDKFEEYLDTFTITKKCSKDSLRNIILDILEYELSEINSYEPLKKHMSAFPFTFENIHTAVFVSPRFPHKVEFGDLSYVCNRKGYLVFTEKFYDKSLTNSPEEIAFLEKSDPKKKCHALWYPEEHGTKEYKESIEEALKISDPKKERFPTLWKTIESMKKKEHNN